MLAVLIIIGLILIVVIPAVSKLLTNNNVKEYNNYLKVIKAGATVFSDKEEDELGTSLDSGCLEVTLEKLIQMEYVKKFDDDKVTCTGKVRLNNKKGNLSVDVNLTCKDENDKVTFEKDEIDSSSTCLAYKPKDDDGLKDKLVANWCSKNTSNCKKPLGQASNDVYVMGNANADNYVWYSGKLWRIVNYNESDGYIKLICNDIITVFPRNNNSTIKYENSLIDKYLQNVFLPSLKEYDKYLKDAVWDTSPTIMPSQETMKAETVTRKVGLLNSYEANQIPSYFSDNYFWLLSNYGNDGNFIYITAKNRRLDTTVRKTVYNYYDYYAIRPAITLKLENYVIAGDGSKDHPYILEGNSTDVKEGTKINTRYSGEYVKINNVKYRIVRTENNLTKIIMTEGFLDAKPFNANVQTGYYKFSLSNIKDSLRSWYETSLGTDKSLIEENGSWCEKAITYPMEFSNNCNENYITSAVGLPTLGDLYTSNNGTPSKEFWTINASSTTGKYTINTVYGGNSVNSINTRYSDKLTDMVSIKPVMYLKSNVIIKSGSGTNDDPFVLKLS